MGELKNIPGIKNRKELDAVDVLLSDRRRDLKVQAFYTIESFSIKSLPL
jgi:hypothetical protein